MKTKISAFEYAIRSVAEPKTLKDYEPISEQESIENRKKKLLEKASRFRILKSKEERK